MDQGKAIVIAAIIAAGGAVIAAAVGIIPLGDLLEAEDDKATILGRCVVRAERFWDSDYRTAIADQGNGQCLLGTSNVHKATPSETAALRKLKDACDPVLNDPRFDDVSKDLAESLIASSVGMIRKREVFCTGQKLCSPDASHVNFTKQWMCLKKIAGEEACDDWRSIPDSEVSVCG